MLKKQDIFGSWEDFPGGHIWGHLRLDADGTGVYVMFEMDGETRDHFAWELSPDATRIHLTEMVNPFVDSFIANRDFRIEHSRELFGGRSFETLSLLVFSEAAVFVHGKNVIEYPAGWSGLTLRRRQGSPTRQP